MRNLLIMVGAPGCGKSTWIKENNLEQYCIAPDTLRLLVSSPEYGTNGEVKIPAKHDKPVWELLDSLLEKRMSLGHFTVIDATHTREKYLKRYKKLADQYRYRLYVKKFDVPVEELLERNAKRDALKKVPEDVIRLHAMRLQHLVIPNSFTMINTANELNEYVRYMPIDKPVYFIGDIHGVFAPLKKFLDEHFTDDALFVFCGDYIDRGNENAETLQRLMDLSAKKNVIFLEGNHEQWLWKWANDETDSIRSREFMLRTKPQLDGIVDKKDVRMFYRKLRSFAALEIGKYNVFACHGGVSRPFPHFISAEQLINGVGEYGDLPAVYAEWKNRNMGFDILVHGHRNTQQYKTDQENCIFNLEGNIEFGGELRVVEINPSGLFEVFSFQNENFVPKIASKGGPDQLMTGVKMIDSLRASDYVKENIFGNISSFNFTRAAFRKQAWDKITTKARGLFINNKTNEIVARSYDKFFNFEEMPETTEQELVKNLKFPVTVYQKYNGFLGIAGYDKVSDTVLYCSKSTIDGDFAKLFKRIADNWGLNGLDEKIKLIVKEGWSLIFEVIAPIEDPHIVEYGGYELILLDIVKNDFVFERMPEEDIRKFASLMNVELKFKAAVFNEYHELSDFMAGRKEVTVPKRFEGFVIEDANHFMFKIKTEWYKTWKMLRSLKDRVHSVNFRISDYAFDETAVAFLNWCKKKDAEYVQNTNIITLRNEFEESRELSTDTQVA